jgi:tRNA threonylcarbamoyladenosine biosynthesis protein TsaE
MSDLINQVSLILPGAIATANLGKRLAEILPAGTVIFLEGNLGAGKTTFVQGLGAGLVITETIDSPTFTLINEYMTGRLPLYHLDLYRLTSEEIEGLYLENYWEGIETIPGIMAIEWGEKLTIRPDNYLQIDFHYDDQQENQRQVLIKSVGNSLNLISPEFLLGCLP